MRLDLQLGGLWPVLAPALGALLVLLVDVVHPATRRAHHWLVAVALAGGAVATVPGLLQETGDRVGGFCLPDGACLYTAGSVASGLQLLALLSALVVLTLAWPDWVAPEDRTSGRSAVLAALLLSATAGVVAVPAAGDLGTLMVALELATLPMVALVALERRTDRHTPAVTGAVALLTTSLVSFALLAMGAALWVAATGTALLSGPAAAAAAARPDRAVLLVLAAVFALSGMAFKISAVPFHAWTPVTYAGAPLPVTVYLATTSKVAALGAVIVLVQALAATSQFTLAAVGVLAALSMTVGNVRALREHDLVRLLAWSAIAQAGWLLLPLASLSSRSVRAAAGYLAVYVVATLLAFVVVVAVAHTPGRGTALADHRGMARRHPLLAASLGLALLALAGLPPAIIGLVAKVVALRPVAGDGTWWLAVVAALNVALGIAVYLRWLVVVIERPPSDEHDRELPEHRGELGTAAPDHPPYLGQRRHHAVILVLSALLVAGSIAPVGVF